MWTRGTSLYFDMQTDNVSATDKIAKRLDSVNCYVLAEGAQTPLFLFTPTNHRFQPFRFVITLSFMYRGQTWALGWVKKREQTNKNYPVLRCQNYLFPPLFSTLKNGWRGTEQLAPPLQSPWAVKYEEMIRTQLDWVKWITRIMDLICTFHLWGSPQWSLTVRSFA